MVRTEKNRYEKRIPGKHGHELNLTQKPWADLVVNKNCIHRVTCIE